MQRGGCRAWECNWPHLGWASRGDDQTSKDDVTAMRDIQASLHRCIKIAPKSFEACRDARQQLTVLVPTTDGSKAYYAELHQKALRPAMLPGSI
eukprot:1158390-Pelagomonas_calceolata.AAC.6